MTSITDTASMLQSLAQQVKDLLSEQQSDRVANARERVASAARYEEVKRELQEVKIELRELRAQLNFKDSGYGSRLSSPESVPSEQQFVTTPSPSPVKGVNSIQTPAPLDTTKPVLFKPAEVVQPAEPMGRINPTEPVKPAVTSSSTTLTAILSPNTSVQPPQGTNDPTSLSPFSTLPSVATDAATDAAQRFPVLSEAATLVAKVDRLFQEAAAAITKPLKPKDAARCSGFNSARGIRLRQINAQIIQGYRSRRLLQDTPWLRPLMANCLSRAIEFGMTRRVSASSEPAVGIQAYTTECQKTRAELQAIFLSENVHLFTEIMADCQAKAKAAFPSPPSSPPRPASQTWPTNASRQPEPLGAQKVSQTAEKMPQMGHNLELPIAMEVDVMLIEGVYQEGDICMEGVC
ncbi:hypothetical protein K505DRAFT_382002 [Melanomma pulvis-pyrius CBS 109.77]|uniref:Uncharacterized protein n=1 Tax=Melanomma pulvis-pyrius CBS 109.77 TaxID=1314802 RepID=A0A6A6XGX5_9PLEO|nr:hypothetical protein K505DRAFT_382002 [Melanomma pulvis-pyrius CBS 109.77]